jgi:hypothetical protein
MLFKDLKTGDTLYLFDKNAISLVQDKVVSISAPHVDTNCAVGMVVDVKVSNRSFTMRDTADICYTDTLVISPDRTTMLREVEAQKANDEALLAREKALKEELPKLDAVIDLLSPERRERKEQEERMNRVEEKLGTLTEMIELMLKNKKDGSK